VENVEAACLYTDRVGCTEHIMTYQVILTHKEYMDMLAAPRADYKSYAKIQAWNIVEHGRDAKRAAADMALYRLIWSHMLVYNVP
jgi:hypothetical protein